MDKLKFCHTPQVELNMSDSSDDDIGDVNINDVELESDDDIDSPKKSPHKSAKSTSMQNDGFSLANNEGPPEPASEPTQARGQTTTEPHPGVPSKLSTVDQSDRDPPEALSPAEPESSAKPLSKSEEKLPAAVVGEGENGGIGDIAYIMVVGFHHTKGNQVEFCYPSVDESVYQKGGLWKHIPFLALPDSAHGSDEDLTFFSTQDPTDQTKTLYGVSCFQQVTAASLATMAADVTRSYVQKSVVILMRKPMFGSTHFRLHAATRMFFQSGDFSKVQVLHKLYKNLNNMPPPAPGSSEMYMGLSARALVHVFRHDTLALFKMLLLEPRMMVYGVPVKNACSTVLTLGSLLPGVMEGGHIPSLIRNDNFNSHATSDFTLFGSEFPICPYLSLEQVTVDLGEARLSSCLVGTSNALFVAHPLTWMFDVLADVTKGKISVFDNRSGFVTAAQMTQADFRFIDKLVRVVERDWAKGSDEDLYDESAWEGSDAWIRAQFGLYLQHLLGTLAGASEIEKVTDETVEGVERRNNADAAIGDYNRVWVRHLTATRSYRRWVSTPRPAPEDPAYRMHISGPRPKLLDEVSSAVQSTVQTSTAFLQNRMKDLEPTMSTTKDRLSEAMGAGLRASEPYKEKLGDVVTKTKGQLSVGLGKTAASMKTSWSYLTSKDNRDSSATKEATRGDEDQQTDTDVPVAANAEGKEVPAGPPQPSKWKAGFGSFMSSLKEKTKETVANTQAAVTNLNEKIQKNLEDRKHAPDEASATGTTATPSEHERPPDQAKDEVRGPINFWRM